MKIKEAIEIINGSTSTVLAEESNGFLHMYHRDLNTYNNWFLEMTIDATNWDSICSDWDCLSNIEPQDLARVMDVIQRLLDTPVKKRSSEKKYRLRWIDDRNGKANYVYLDIDATWRMVTLKNFADIFTESELEQLKKDNPHFAPAIDAMKEPAEDKND